MKIENFTLYKSQREIHTDAARAAPGDLGLNSHPKDSTEMNILIWSPIQDQTRADVA